MNMSEKKSGTVKNFAAFIAKMIKFFSTFIGQIVFFVLAALTLGILIYIIANVIVKDIATIIGIDDPGMKLSDKSEYEVMINLHNSGYNEIMPADELQDYASFEYACLMDAAWYLKLTGAYSVSYVNQGTMDLGQVGNIMQETMTNPAYAEQYNQIKGVFSQLGMNIDGMTGADISRWVWAVLNAEANLPAGTGASVANGIMSSKSGIRDAFEAVYQNTKSIQQDTMSRYNDTASTSEGSGGEVVGGGSDTPDNTYTQNEIFFLPESSSITGETSLVPYMLIHRQWDKNVYRFYDEHPENRYNSVASLNATKGNPLYIYLNIWALMANKELNSLNIAARFNAYQLDGDGAPLDLYKEYPEELWYATEPMGPTTYKIPFKVLVDRYLPKAVLLSAWYEAKDSAPADNSDDIDDLLKDIKAIYSEACLKGEAHDDGIATPGDPASHKESFMHFERGVAEQSVPTYRNWYSLSPAEQLFIVTDLDEIQPYKFPNTIEFTGIAEKYDTEIINGKEVRVLVDRQLVQLSFDTRDKDNPEKRDTELLRAYSLAYFSFDLEDVENQDYPKTAAEESGYEFNADGTVKVAPEGSLIVPNENKQAKMDEENLIRTKYLALAGEMEGGTKTQSFQPGITDQIMSGTLVIPRPLSGDGYDTRPPKNAAPSDMSGFARGENVKSPPPGESKILEEDGYTYMKLQQPGDVLVCTDPEGFYNAVTERYASEVEGEERAWESRGYELSLNLVESSADIELGERLAMFTVEERVCTIGTDVEIKKMPMYFTKLATTWSSIKEFHTRFILQGNPIDPDNYLYLVQKQRYNTGLKDIEIIVKDMQWRTKLFAPIFGGGTAREADVTLMLSEWENVANQSTENSSAYTYIRDLYRLIHYSKGVKEDDVYLDKEKEILGLGDGSFVIDPEGDYVKYTSYSFMNVAEEITLFDETTSEKAFWLDHFLATLGLDKITEQENKEMRNALPLKTWQIVDYALYPETNGTVYASWPLGGILGKTVIASTLGASGGHAMLMEYGSWEEGVHGGNDWNGRAHVHKVYQSVYGAKYDPEEPLPDTAVPSLVTTYSGGKVTISGSDISVSSIKGRFKLAEGPVTIDFDGQKHTFNSAVGAAYGYQLYRLTAAMKSPLKARQYLKEQMEEEIMWTPIVAIAPGFVKSVSASATGGFEVIVEHADGEDTYSCHMKRYPVAQEGQYVGVGTVLGYEGTTGNSGGFHIHFEIKQNEYGNPYFFPFFSPFYFEEKTFTEDGQRVGLDSDYLSIERTSYPVGMQIPDAKEGEEWSGIDEAGAAGTLHILERENGGGAILIKNYLPESSYLGSWTELYNETDNMPSKYKELNQLIPTEPYTSIDGGGSSVDVKASPDYFSTGDMAAYDETLAFEEKIEEYTPKNWEEKEQEESDGNLD